MTQNCYAMRVILIFLQLLLVLKFNKRFMYFTVSVLFSSVAVKQLFICASLLCNSDVVFVTMHRAPVRPLNGCCASVTRKTQANIEEAD
jgi:hypothetical protein